MNTLLVEPNVAVIAKDGGLVIFTGTRTVTTGVFGRGARVKLHISRDEEKTKQEYGMA